MKESILLCGGKGTRLREISQDKPKSLFEVAGKELIRYSTDIMTPDIVNKLIFAVDYKAEQISEWVNRMNFPQEVKFSYQSLPGVVEAIRNAAEYLTRDEMITCNTDELREGLNLEKILSFHQRAGTMATMVASYSNRLYRHRLLDVRESDGRVLSSRLKPAEYINRPEVIGLVNTGFLIMDKKTVELFDVNHSRDWGGIIDPLCDSGQLSAYIDNRIVYFNVGTPEEYKEASDFLSQQIPPPVA